MRDRNIKILKLTFLINSVFLNKGYFKFKKTNG